MSLNRLGILFFTVIICFVSQPSVAIDDSNTSAAQTEPERRAKPAPYDDIFPSPEYSGPTIGVPNTDPIFPLTKLLWKEIPKLKEKDIRIYGWVNPSYNASTSTNSNVPSSYMIVPNHLELDQLVLRMQVVIWLHGQIQQAILLYWH